MDSINSQMTKFQKFSQGDEVLIRDFRQDK